jgi:hypothetical protein
MLLFDDRGGRFQKLIKADKGASRRRNRTRKKQKIRWEKMKMCETHVEEQAPISRYDMNGTRQTKSGSWKKNC